MLKKCIMIKNQLTLIAAIFGAVIFSTGTLVAATWTFDANTGTTGAQDGSGTWDASTLNWWTGSADSAWNNANNAQFGAGTDGAVGAYPVP